MKRSLWNHKKIALFLVLGALFTQITSSTTFAENSGQSSQQKRASTPKRKFPLHNFIFDTETPLAVVIRTIADLERINVIYEDSIAKLAETKKVIFVAKDVTAPHALELLLSAQRFGYAPVDKRTIILFPEALANKQRYQEAFTRVFYLKNAVLEDARNTITQTIGSNKIIPLKQLNALVVRDTEENFKLIEALLNRIDKPRSEFVIDMNLYDVGDQATSQLGNQSGTLSAAELSQLQNKGSWKLIGTTKLHASEYESATVNMGKRIAVPNKIRRTAATATEQPRPSEGSGQNGDTGVNRAGAEEEQYQYIDIGLNMDLSPTASDDYVHIKMNLDMSGAINAQPNTEFNHHRVKEIVTIKQDETKIVANTFQLSTVFFAGAGQKSSAPNLIITLTPHVIRAPEVTPVDRTIVGPNGTANVFDGGISLEEMLIKADQNDE